VVAGLLRGLLPGLRAPTPRRRPPSVAQPGQRARRQLSAAVAAQRAEPGALPRRAVVVAETRTECRRSQPVTATLGL